MSPMRPLMGFDNNGVAYNFNILTLRIFIVSQSRAAIGQWGGLGWIFQCVRTVTIIILKYILGHLPEKDQKGWYTAWQTSLANDEYLSDLISFPDSKVHGPTWGPSGADRTQVGPMLAPWTLLSGLGFRTPRSKLSTNFNVSSWSLTCIIHCWGNAEETRSRHVWIDGMCRI